MSLILKGLDMPKSCFECPFKITSGISSGQKLEFNCAVINYAVLEDYMTDDKPTNCPLVEIPTPHGRLIDADKVFTYDHIAEEQLKEVPTILESEE